MNIALIVTAVWILLAVAACAFVHGAAKLRAQEEAQLRAAPAERGPEKGEPECAAAGSTATAGAAA